MAAIDAETIARKRGSPRAVAGWFTGLMAGFSPRTLAIAASFAALAIALQAFLLVSIHGGDQVASLDTASSGEHGTYAMVRFARQASAAEITKFLENYQATLVDGPRAGGLYRVKIAMTSLAKEELAALSSECSRIASSKPQTSDSE